MPSETKLEKLKAIFTKRLKERNWLTRFQKAIIHKGTCVTLFSYFILLKNDKSLFWNKGDIFEYVILNTDEYTEPLQKLNTHRVLIDDYWMPIFEAGFDMYFEDLSKWRERQIDLILDDF